MKSCLNFKVDPRRRVGQFVSDNVRNETHLNVHTFSELLAGLNAQGPFGSSYSGHVRAFESQGDLATRPELVEVLQRLIPSHVILRAAFKADLVGPPGADLPVTEWRAFQAAWRQATTNMKRTVLEEARLSWGSTCFAFFELREFSKTIQGFARLYERLGLGWAEVELAKRDQADPPIAVLVRYHWDDVEDVRIPTVANGGWSHRFVPAPPGAQYGRTLDASGADDGLPEIVHQNRDLTCLRDWQFTYSEQLR